MSATAVTYDPTDYVRRGAALLDERNPDWADRVDTTRLNLGSDRVCVLGQLYGSYQVGRAALSGEQSATAQHAWACQHGFAVADHDPFDSRSYPELTQAWRVAVNRRRPQLMAGFAARVV